MNPNPFKPTAGKRPPILIGRESVIEDFEEGLDNGAGAPGRLILITGNRGCGKTVLLRELQRLANERGWAVVSDSASLGLCDRLADALRSNKPVVTSMELSPSFGRMSVEAARARVKRCAGWSTSALRSSIQAKACCLRLTRHNRRLSRSWRPLPFSISRCSETRMPRACPIATSAVLRWCLPAYPVWLTICSKSRA